MSQRVNRYIHYDLRQRRHVLQLGKQLDCLGASKRRIRQRREGQIPGSRVGDDTEAGIRWICVVKSFGFLQETGIDGDWAEKEEMTTFGELTACVDWACE